MLVTFNNPMSDDAEDPANYVIVQENVLPEAGALIVTDAIFASESRTFVVLATLSQSQLTYQLTVVNIEDMEGNQIAPKELLVDPATVTFPGTPPTCLPACTASSPNPGGFDTNGSCNTDDDCDDDAPCEDSEADCAGTCEDNCEAVDTDGGGLSDLSELRDTYPIPLFDPEADPSAPPASVLIVRPYSDWVVTAGDDGACNTAASFDDVTVPQAMGIIPSKICIASGPNGVIDSTPPAGDDEVVAAAKIDPGPASPGPAPRVICDTTTRSGDDVVERIVNDGALGTVCISAGPNGVIDTETVGDDFLRVAHRGLFGTDPANRDTDFDGLPDGREVLLGTNPNTNDAGSVTDTDGDTLKDGEELHEGWTVAVVGEEARHVNPNPLFTDFDSDGLDCAASVGIGEGRTGQMGYDRGRITPYTPSLGSSRGISSAS